MNKEQQEVLDDAYNRYRATIIKEFYEDTKELRKWATVEGPGGHTKEEFINKCKTDTEFSERWGLKIEERELTYSERYKMWFSNNYETGMEYYEDNVPDFNDEYYEPTPIRLITVTYNDKTIESYE